LIQPGYIVTGIQQAAFSLTGAYLQNRASPYAALYASFLKNMTSSRAASETTPEDCARIILQAIESRRPKIRYPVTRLATFAKWSRKLLSDRAVDTMLLRRFGASR